MNAIIPGAIVFMVVTGIISGFILVNFKTLREQGVVGAELVKRLAPFLLADFAFVIIFVVWLMRNL